MLREKNQKVKKLTEGKSWHHLAKLLAHIGGSLQGLRKKIPELNGMGQLEKSEEQQ